MPLGAFLFACFKAIAAVPVMISQMEALASSIVGWYVQRQKSETLALIADAAALSARAQTTEDRYAAAQAWQTALSRPRISS